MVVNLPVGGISLKIAGESFGRCAASDGFHFREILDTEVRDSVMFLRPRFLLAFLVFALVFTAEAQTRPAKDDQRKDAQQKADKRSGEVGENDVVRVTTALIKVPVAVRTREGGYVNDLTKDDFKVYENGVEQQIAYFSSARQARSIVLLIDITCSIERPKDTIAATLAFIDQLSPEDSVLPIAFGREIYQLLPDASRDRQLLRKVITELPDEKRIPCDNITRLGDAVEFVINHILDQGKERTALVLLTDGRDSTGYSKPGWYVRSLRAASEIGAPIYSLRLISKWDGGDDRFRGFPGTPQAERAQYDFFWRDVDAFIDDLASFSGGRFFRAARGEELKKYFLDIGEELRNQYVLAYYGDTSKEKQERRKIKVRVNRQKMSVRARESYLYIPPEK